MSKLDFDPSVFWDRPFPIVLASSEMRVLWVGAVRYAMTRGTGASRMTAEAVRAHLGDIDDGTLEIVARDIRSEAEAWSWEAVGAFAPLPGEIDRELEGRRA